MGRRAEPPSVGEPASGDVSLPGRACMTPAQARRHLPHPRHLGLPSCVVSTSSFPDATPRPTLAHTHACPPTPTPPPQQSPAGSPPLSGSDDEAAYLAAAAHRHGYGHGHAGARGGAGYAVRSSEPGAAAGCAGFAWGRGVGLGVGRGSVGVCSVEGATGAAGRGKLRDGRPERTGAAGTLVLNHAQQTHVINRHRSTDAGSMNAVPSQGIPVCRRL
jgi:hypothetical protein